MKTLYKNNLNGMQVFSIVWFGQLVSIMGTAMTKFALLIWAYEQIGKASTTALLGFFSILPSVLLSPLAGAVVDRFNRKKIMLLSDLGSGIVTVMLLVINTSGNLQVWHLYAAEALSGVFGAFQRPAFSSSITMLIPKEKYSRASGMRSFSNYSSQVLAPILGGFLMLIIGVQGVMIIDIVTFFIAMGTLTVVAIPQPQRKITENPNNISKDIKFAFEYLIKRKDLLLLMIIFLGMNFLAGLTYFGILPAMILARTGNDKIVLASIQSALGVGGVVGSLVVSLWKGAKSKVNLILITGAASFFFGDIFLAANSTVYIWYTAAFLSSFFIPFITAGQDALWQSKVAPNIQGRIFSIRGMLQTGLAPIGYLLGGMLADYVFEPAMIGVGYLSELFGWFVGTGKGSGMALMFLFTGIFGTLTCLCGFLSKDLRQLEDSLPDHEIANA
jgi:DHA3 family macrolide efflux protein-like MFS transporter